MIHHLKISGFKNFRGKEIFLRDLKKVNIFVGINGAGKSSVLEALAALNNAKQISSGKISPGVDSTRLYSLFEPETKIDIFGQGEEVMGIKIVPASGQSPWDFYKNGDYSGSLRVVAIWNQSSSPYQNRASAPNPNDIPFANVESVNDGEITDQDYLEATRLFIDVNPDQRIITTRSVSFGQFHLEDRGEIRPELLAGGTKQIARVLTAFRKMERTSNPILLIDDLGDSIFPAFRKGLIRRIIELQSALPASMGAQIFATTHNIEIVKAAFELPEICNVYMVDYSGKLIEFGDDEVKLTDTSSGVMSNNSILLIGKMLGLSDLDLGFPEIVILAEEESKRTFLNAVKDNSNFGNVFRKFDIQVAFQCGDGGLSNAINSLLDMSKYFFYSEIWSDRYAIFTDCNPSDFNLLDGLVKDGSARHLKALGAAQKILGLNRRFILTKQGANYVDALEKTYPENLWTRFKVENSIPEQATLEQWISTEENQGKSKNKLAAYVGSNISKEEFETSYPDLWNLIKR